MNRWLLTLIGQLTLGNAVGARQQLTIPELIERSRPDPVHVTRVREVVPPNLEELVARSTIVVRGTVRILRTYLSPDQRTLLTDYEVVPQRFIAHSGPPLTAKGPGVVPLVFTRWGGETTINGLKVIVQDLNVRPLVEGDDMILFLRRPGASDRYELVSPVAAMFSVGGGRVRPHVVGSPDQDDLARLSPDEFSNEIQRASAAKLGNRAVR